MKIMKFFLVFIALIVSIGSNAFVNCHGKLNSVYLNKNGELTIHPTWFDDYVTVCSIKGDWKGISPDICKGWLSVAMTAQVSQGQTVIQYGSLDDCKDVGSYGNAQSPNYLMLYGLDG